MLLRNGRVVGNATPANTATIIKFALQTRIITYILANIANWYIRDYDSSNNCAFLQAAHPGSIDSWGDRLICHTLNMLTHWDGVYFLRVAEVGTYEFEQMHAFFPLVPLVTRYGSYLVSLLSMGMLSQRSCLVLAGVLFSLVSFVVAAYSLYRLTLAVTRDESFALTSALLFCLTPASIFMTATYSEAPYAALSFLALWALAEGQYILATLALIFGGLVRSNNVVLCGFILYPVFVQTGRWFFASSLSTDKQQQRLSLPQLLWPWLRAILCTSLVAVSTVMVLYYGYDMYCTGSVVPRRPWCDERIPSIYAFVQKKYWNVGFLNYYEAKQIPNFLLAAPIVTLGVSAIYQHARHNWRAWTSLGIQRQETEHSIHESRNMSIFLNTDPVYMFHWLILLVIGVTVVHIQVLTRFLAACPPLYWYTAVLIHSKNRHIRIGTLVYCMLYQALGAIVFTNFYPWT